MVTIVVEHELKNVQQEGSTQLRIIGWKFTNEDIEAITNVLENNTTLTSLVLEYNKIDDEIAKALANSLKDNKTITHVDLGFNNIGSEGAKALATALKSNKTITSLDLNHNNISDEGAQAIAEALKENKTLNDLHLVKNNIGSEGAKALANALKDNKTLTYLMLVHNNIGAKEFTSIHQTIERNQNIVNKLAGLLAKETVGGRHVYDAENAKFSNLQNNIAEILKEARKQHPELGSKYGDILNDKKIIKNLGKILSEEPGLFKDNMSKNFLYACAQKVYNFFAAIFMWDSSYLKGTVELQKDKIVEKKGSFVAKLEEEAKLKSNGQSIA